MHFWTLSCRLYILAAFLHEQRDYRRGTRYMHRDSLAYLFETQDRENVSLYLKYNYVEVEEARIHQWKLSVLFRIIKFPAQMIYLEVRALMMKWNKLQGVKGFCKDLETDSLMSWILGVFAIVWAEGRHALLWPAGTTTKVWTPHTSQASRYPNQPLSKMG